MELLDQQGTSIPAFAGDRCAPVRGDGTKLPVTWSGAERLRRSPGRPCGFASRSRRAGCMRSGSAAGRLVRAAGMSPQADRDSPGRPTRSERARTVNMARAAIRRARVDAHGPSRRVLLAPARPLLHLRLVAAAVRLARDRPLRRSRTAARGGRAFRYDGCAVGLRVLPRVLLRALRASPVDSAGRTGRAECVGSRAALPAGVAAGEPSDCSCQRRARRRLLVQYNLRVDAVV